MQQQPENRTGCKNVPEADDCRTNTWRKTRYAKNCGTPFLPRGQSRASGTFLRRGHLPARLANFAFNAVCKAARDVRRVTRRQERPPAQAGVCALIAELSLPQCLHYRVRERAAQLEHLGWKVRTCDWLDYESATLALQLADCALFYRVSMIRHVPALYAEARRLGLPILYDIDDLIFLEEDLAAHLAPMRLPPELAARMLEFAPKIREAMEAADVRLVSTLGLKKRVDSMLQPETARSGDGPGRKCFVVHNSIADELAAMARELPARTGSDNEIRMFYGSGSDTHGADFMLIADALRQAMEKDARLHLHLHGPLELPPGFESCAGRVHCVPFLDKDIYYRIMADYDIALMPLVQDVFNDGKSDIKYQEASLFGIPSIASSSAEFLASITDGVDGLIAAARKNGGTKFSNWLPARLYARPWGKGPAAMFLPAMPARLSPNGSWLPPCPRRKKQPANAFCWSMPFSATTPLTERQQSWKTRPWRYAGRVLKSSSSARIWRTACRKDASRGGSSTASRSSAPLCGRTSRRMTMKKWKDFFTRFCGPCSRIWFISTASRAWAILPRMPPFRRALRRHHASQMVGLPPPFHAGRLGKLLRPADRGP